MPGKFRPTGKPMFLRQKELSSGQRTFCQRRCPVLQFVPPPLDIRGSVFRTPHGRPGGGGVQARQGIEPAASPVTNRLRIARFAGLLQLLGEFSILLQVGAGRQGECVRHTNLLSSACLASAQIRLKEGSRPSTFSGGWALPFPRTGCAPGASLLITCSG